MNKYIEGTGAVSIVGKRRKEKKMKKFMKKFLEKKESKKGFTLVELIVVLVILAILMAIMIPAMTGWIGKAKEKQNDLTARTAYLGAQSVAADILEKNDTITAAGGANPITLGAVEEYTGDLGLDENGFVYSTDGTTVESVTVTIGGKLATYPKTESTP